MEAARKSDADKALRLIAFVFRTVVERSKKNI